MWNFLTLHGITVLRAVPLILLSSILIAVMFTPLEINVYPKLQPLLPLKKKDDQKSPLRKEQEEKPSLPNDKENPSDKYPLELIFKVTIKIEKEEK
jgi:hypothetical protein